MATSSTVTCPICSRQVSEQLINQHLDANCRDAISGLQPRPVAPIFKTGGLTSRPTQKRKALGDFPRSSAHITPVKRSKQTIGSHLQAVAPLAERLRPNTLDEFVGQVHLTGPNSFLSTLTEKGAVGSIILWGPPGCGKTTLARLIAKGTNAIFKELNATAVGINDVRVIFDEAKSALQLTGRRTILFLDEIHRFTRSQQDIFLPFLERGFVQLIGTTTENPSFKLNGALLSRCRVFVLERLTDEEIIQIIKKAIARVASSAQDESVVTALSNPSAALLPDVPARSSPIESPQLSVQLNVTLEPSAPTSFSMASLAAGDARTALSLLEHVLLAPAETSEPKLLDSMKHSVATSYDRTGEARYNFISALHKSIRGSQGGAALYWLARMLEASEDPMYIARRLVVCASEDIGTADPRALPLAMAALQACQVIGMPECRINLAHVVTYLSEAPKSTRALEAYDRAKALANQDMTLPVPISMRNALTPLMRELGYGENYKYQPQFVHPVTNEYLPPQIRREIILREEGDLTEKKRDPDALKQWEDIENGGQAWAGRPSSS
ncbi:DNA polymerase III, clamp loader complex, gamma/delta/delta subunit [Russula compacta]|nr:DNA polymerase III, clamp loader complex, gamma/delta/delta subunit [Russula compacta]